STLLRTGTFYFALTGMNKSGAHDKKVICSMGGSVKMLAPTVVCAVGLSHDQPYFSTPSSRRVVGGSVAAPADAPRLGQRTPDEMWASPLCLPTRSQGAARAVLHAHPGHGRYDPLA